LAFLLCTRFCLSRALGLLTFTSFEFLSSTFFDLSLLLLSFFDGDVPITRRYRRSWRSHCIDNLVQVFALLGPGRALMVDALALALQFLRKGLRVVANDLKLLFRATYTFAILLDLLIEDFYRVFVGAPPLDLLRIDLANHVAPR